MDIGTGRFEEIERAVAGRYHGGHRLCMLRDVTVRNTATHSQLMGDFEQHAPEIIDSGRRPAAGHPIGSGRMKKGVDQVIGQRQKHQAMAWSATGSKAPAILNGVELNGQWQSLWSPEEQDYQAVA